MTQLQPIMNESKLLSINYLIFALFTIPLGLYVLFSGSSHANFNLAVQELTNYEILGMDRFQWYTKTWKRAFADGEQPPHIEDVSMLGAYEFDVEYSISITTPGKYKAIVYCRYFDDSGKELLPAFQSYNFPEYVVNCEKRQGVKRVSVSAQEDSNYTTPIEMIDRTKREYHHELSFCLSAIYGDEPKWLLLSEVVEHYKLQGATHSYFYIFHSDAYSMAVVNDYVRTGEVTVIRLVERNQRADLEWQMVGIRDCTLRNRFESKWIIVADLDERLLMTDYSGTLIEYLRTLNDYKTGSIQFRQQWIMKTERMPDKYEGEKQIDEWSPTLRWHNSSAFGPPGHTSKCIIMPEKVFAMSVHFAELFYPGFKTRELAPKQGIVRHYRDLQMGNWGNTWLKDVLEFGPMSMTNYPQKYQRNLTDAVKKRLHHVYNDNERLNK